MISLSEFLANYIETVSGIKLSNVIRNGIAAYAKSLQRDHPETVGWAMKEKELVTALELMESTTKPVEPKCRKGWGWCPQPEFMMHMGCDECELEPNPKVEP